MIMLNISVGMAQSIVFDDKSNDIKPTIETRNIDSSQISINAPVETAPEAISTGISNKEVTPGFAVFEGIEAREMKGNEYIASVDLGRLILPGDGFDNFENPAGYVMLGLKRPYYRFGEDMRFSGLVDLRAGRSLAGLGNSAIITFRYDLRRNHDERSLKMSMFFVHISYKINIPFGGRTKTQHR
jgi:hypothetical protein